MVQVAMYGRCDHQSLGINGTTVGRALISTSVVIPSFTYERLTNEHVLINTVKTGTAM
jgi:hypothetical protein